EQRRNEQFLREAVEKYANPGGDRVSRDLGLRHSLELGVLYLKEDRLEEADQFFAGLIKVPVYRILGRLGHAIVLARQDHAIESNKLFLELVGAKPRAG